MAEVVVMDNRESDPTALAAEATATGGGKPRKPRATDGGPEILPDMGHYVTLVRKIKHRALVAQWLQHLHPEELPGIEWEHKVCTSYKQCRGSIKTDTLIRSYPIHKERLNP